MKNLIWLTAWKNVWRNKNRSMVVISAVILGTIAGVFAAGIMKGWVEQRIHTALYNEVSHLKVLNNDFLDNEELGKTLSIRSEIEQFLKVSPEVTAFSGRLKVLSMANTSRGNWGFMVNGIKVENEKKVSEIYKNIIAGDYVSDDKQNGILISDKTAELLRVKTYRITAEVLETLISYKVSSEILEKLNSLVDKRFTTEKLFKSEIKNLLNIKDFNQWGSLIVNSAKNYNLNSKVILTFADFDGQMVYLNFRVCGVYKTTNTMFDSMNAYVNYSELIKSVALPEGSIHEIAILISDYKKATQFSKELMTKFPDNAVLTWKQMASDIGMMADFMDVYYYIIMGIILFALAFGIINTMLMAILERIKELGMLMAIGMNKKKVFNMIMLETILLTFVGAFIGMILGAILIAVTHKTGLDFGESIREGFEAIGYAAKIYPAIDWSFFIGVTILVIITGIVSSIIPARKALKMNPVEAIRIE